MFLLQPKGLTEQKLCLCVCVCECEYVCLSVCRFKKKMLKKEMAVSPEHKEGSQARSWLVGSKSQKPRLLLGLAVFMHLG